MKQFRRWLLMVLGLTLILAAACTATPAPVTPPATSLMPTTAAPSQTVPPSTATPSPTAVTPAPQSAVAPILAQLSGLGIDQFFEESYRQWLLRDPESLTELGLATLYKAPNDQLTDISESYIRDTQALESGILELLQTYDRNKLTPEQQLSADIYTWMLEDRVRGHEFMDDDYPVSQFIYSVDLDLTQYFTDLRPMKSRQDAEDYLTALSQVHTKFAQLLDGLQRREAAGVILPKFLIPETLSNLRGIAQSSARATPFYTAFADKVNQLSGVSRADREALLAAAEKEIDTTVIPAFQSLVTYFEHLQTVATDDAGVWKFPNGDAYYAYLLYHYTTTDLTADEIHELGQQELERIHAEMRTRFDQLGYPQTDSLRELYQRVAQAGGVVSGGQMIPTCEALIQTAEQKIDPVFDLRPKAKVIVVNGPSGGYYMPPAVDGSRPGMYYVGPEQAQYRFSIATTLYHETVPGHHLQIAIAQELSLPALRRGSDFTGYVEGWALYAERLAWELGLYEGDPYGDLGRLQMEAFRAARLVVDTGLHAKHWTYDQAVDYMVEATGRSRGAVGYEVSRYVVLPGQATAYYVGYLKILELRQKAQDALGDRFDLREFHHVILSQGAVPLEILEQLVDAYIQQKLSGG